MKKHNDLVLSIHPVCRGFGWAFFEGPATVIDWGVAHVKGNHAVESLSRLAVLFDELRPTALVLEEFDGPTVRRSEWVRQFCQDAIELACDKGIVSRTYSRAEVKALFRTTVPPTRFEIARTIAKQFGELAHELPPKRLIWLPENPRMGLFNAAAVALTHYALGGVA